MARRLLSAPSWSVVVFGLALASCRHHDNGGGPTQSASAAASVAAAGGHFTLETHALHFAAEMKRAQERWQSKPSLEDCPKLLHESTDAELCSAAQNGLAAIEALPPDAPTSTVIPVLANGSLALARLSQRARYQSMVELGQKRLAGDAGAPAPAVSGSAHPTGPRPTHLPRSPFSPRDEHPVMELDESPVSKFLTGVLRLERDTLRNLSAYLEYAALPVRRSTFDAVKQLRDVRPQWQQLDHLIREAALLESDPDLKRDLNALAASGLPRGEKVGPAQPVDSK